MIVRRKPVNNQNTTQKNSNPNSKEKNNLHDLGQEIEDIITSTLDSAFKTVKKEINNQRPNQRSQTQTCNKRPNTRPTYFRRPYKHVAVGSVSGVLLTVFGILGMIGFGIPALVLGILGATNKLFTIFLVIFFISLYMKNEGSYIRNRLKRYYRYLGIFKDQTSYSLKDLSKLTDKSQRYLYKDLRKMIQVGMFPEGAFDEDRTFIMLTRKRYREYLDQRQESKNTAFVSTADFPESKGDSQYKTGYEMAHEMEVLKNEIQSPEVQKRIHRTHVIAITILDYAQKKAINPHELRRFINYYLPETLQLIKVYRNLEKNQINGENIERGKDEIYNTLETINQALEKLFDNLFTGEVMNITSNISVLNTVITQDGLNEPSSNTEQ